jgi:hypothetical protein
MIPRNFAGPLPSPNFHQQVAAVIQPPLVGFYSGEVDASVGSSARPLGLIRYAGKITGVYLSVSSCGKDDTPANTPRISGEVYINGTTCLTTTPKIGCVSGETAAQKTTMTEAADTSVVAAVIDQTANAVAAGDVITWAITYGGGSSPTTKLKHPCILVEVTPT